MTDSATEFLVDIRSSLTIRPSCSVTRRCARSATSAAWVTTMIVRPSRWISSNRDRISSFLWQWTKRRIPASRHCGGGTLSSATIAIDTHNEAVHSSYRPRRDWRWGFPGQAGSAIRVWRSRKCLTAP